MFDACLTTSIPEKFYNKYTSIRKQKTYVREAA